MKTALVICIAFIFLSSSIPAKVDDIRDMFVPSLAENDVAFMFLSYSGVIIRTAKGTVIIDPANLLKDKELHVLEDEDVDLILFTHGHGDHYNPDSTVDLFDATEAPVLAESSVANSLKEAIPPGKVTIAAHGKTYTFGDITVDAVKGIHRGPIILFRIIIGGLSLFHAGDSGYISLKDYPAELAFLPTGAPSPTASPENAFKMAADLNPGVVVAIHGSAGQSKEFEGKVKKVLPGTTVVIPEAFTVKVVTLPE